MRWLDRHRGIGWAFVVLAAIAVLAKQGIAIGQHGFSGWLAGDGGSQAEWEVRAVIALLLVGAPALVIAVILRSGEDGASRAQEWRWARAIKRSRKP